MRTPSFTLVASLGLFGCWVQPFGPDGGSGEGGQNCNTKQDMSADMSMVQPASCPAATGLSGTLIDCFDFSKETIATLSAKGWSFDTGTGCAWDVKSNALTNTAISQLAGDCALKLSAKNIPQNKSSITFSIVQQGGIGTNLLASLFLFSTTKAALFQTSNMNNSQTSVTFISSDSRLVSNQYQVIVQESNSGMGLPSGPGWQISSIAVMGNP